MVTALVLRHKISHRRYFTISLLLKDFLAYPLHSHSDSEKVVTLSKTCIKKSDLMIFNINKRSVKFKLNCVT